MTGSIGYSRNAGKRWRRDDLANLRMLARKGAPLRLISLKLGRPDAAIRAKARDLGLSITAGDTVVAPAPTRTLARDPERPLSRGAQMDLFVAA